MKRLPLGLACACILLAGLGPFAWMGLTSLKAPQEVIQVPPTWVPAHPSIESYQRVFAQRPFGRFLLNSARLSLGTALLTVALAALASYPLARSPSLRWAERLLLLGAVFPPIVLVVPLFEAAQRLGAIDRPGAVILVYSALNLPFAVWSLTAFFRAVPRELEEAAALDGFSRTGYLVRVLLPLSAPGLATTALLVFLFAWNEFLLALTLLPDERVRTAPVGIAMLSGVSPYEVPWDQISAAVVLTTLPVVALAFLLQRRIVEGLTAGGVKG